MKYLLDTNVVSELIKPRPAEKVFDWLDSHDVEDLYISVLTIGELQKGIEKQPSPQRREELHAWLERDLLVSYEGRLVPVTLDVMRQWGILVARLEMTGRISPVIDSLLAVTALHGDYTIVTRYEADFAPFSVALVNPWK